MSAQRWKLGDLLSRVGISAQLQVCDRPVTQVSDDSREIRPGALFVAVRGTQTDGHRWISDAIRRGAAAVMSEQELSPVPAHVAKIRVSATRPLLGPLVHAFLGSPSHRLKVIGVTGTNGKTTTAWWVHHLLTSAGVESGLLSTISDRIGARVEPATHTTAGSVALQSHLAQMVAEGMPACAMEVSSHALDQHRTDGIRWAAAIFTNLTPEHLDYHGSMEQYREAKLRLFGSLDAQSLAVVNQADPTSDRIQKQVPCRCLSYGWREGADMVASEPEVSLTGTRFRLAFGRKTFFVRSPLIGRHNVENLLAALTTVQALGIPLKKGIEAVADFSGVPGRLSRVEGETPCPVFVDYAHTDDALRRVLQELRAASGREGATPRRILTVFGCGGDRDRAKRPRMGQTAAALSDRVIVTNDNPRSEEPMSIAREILAGMNGESAFVEIVLDRREAIRRALGQVDGGWLILIAGKGHEQGQVVGDRVVPFNDAAVVRDWSAVGSLNSGGAK